MSIIFYMKRIIFLLVLFGSFFIQGKSVFAQEKINDFQVTINIQKDGKIAVFEKISYDFGDLQRHGIFRTIPFLKTNSDGKKFKLQIDNISVTDEIDKSYQLVQSVNGDDIQLKIGDPDTLITGSHIYNINYEVSGALTYFSDHDELYWNGIGTGWEVPIEKARIIVNKTFSSNSENDRIKCFVGIEGTSSEDCGYSLKDADIIFDSKRSLNIGEGFTIVYGFPKGQVVVLEPELVVSFWQTILGKVTAVVLAVLALLWYLVYPIRIIYKWYKYGQDPKVGIPATAYFDPPKTEKGRSLTPAETGALVDENADLRDVMATIVDLARRGYYKIIEKKKNDFYFIAPHPRGDQKQVSLPGGEKIFDFEEKLIGDIFDGETEIRLKDKKLYDTVTDVQNMIYNQLVADKFFPKNPQNIRLFYQVMATLGLFSGNLFLFIIALLFGRNMPVKTMLGAKEANKAKALRNFLKSQERQLQFQGDKQLLFEKLLPYAVAFGVEKAWARRFESIALRPPDWYQGYGSSTRFNSVLLASSLSSSFSSFYSAATPVRSSSGFSSGFSGGSSGGGGGGGGGGSW